MLHWKNCVYLPVAARGLGLVFSSGHMAALESNWCCVGKKGRMGTGWAMQCVPQDAVIIPLILFEFNPFEIIVHTKWVLHVALLNSFSFKVIKMQKSP